MSRHKPTYIERKWKKNTETHKQICAGNVRTYAEYLLAPKHTLFDALNLKQSDNHVYLQTCLQAIIENIENKHLQIHMSDGALLAYFMTEDLHLHFAALYFTMLRPHGKFTFQ